MCFCFFIKKPHHNQVHIQGHYGSSSGSTRFASQQLLIQHLSNLNYLNSETAQDTSDANVDIWTKLKLPDKTLNCHLCFDESSFSWINREIYFFFLVHASLSNFRLRSFVLLQKETFSDGSGASFLFKLLTEPGNKAPPDSLLNRHNLKSVNFISNRGIKWSGLFTEILLLPDILFSIDPIWNQ